MCVTAFQDLPLADRDREWDGAAAEKRVRRWADAADEPNESATSDSCRFVRRRRRSKTAARQ
jgi:hypothetical protein